MIIYAGIGSRETPRDILDIMEEIGLVLGEQGHILRSGHSPGADQAFERGAKDFAAQIYLPWTTFSPKPKISKKHSTYLKPTIAAMNTVNEYHPNPKALTFAGRKLHARNSHIVLGYDLNTPVDFILCWTFKGKGSGGTGQAIRIAKKHDIPIFDLGNAEDYKVVQYFIYEEWTNT